MLKKKVVLPWVLFALTAMYAMLRPCTVVVHTPCNSTDVHPQVPIQPHYVEVPLHPHYVEVPVQPHYVEVPTEHHAALPEDQSDSEVVHYVRRHVEHVQAPIQADEHPPTLFVMSVTLLLYLFMKVVVVPPRGYKKYI